MANFNTHISYAAAGSGLLSVLCLQVGLVTPSEALLMALLGSIGGILPDVDLQHSYPSRMMFSVAAIAVAFSIVFSLENDLSVLELWFIGLCAFAAVRYPIWTFFHQHTTHRGTIHSLLAAVCAGFVTVFLAHWWLDKSPFVSWLLGLFTVFGFLIHLLLDEVYSVDFSNRRIKRSFGTALKFYDYKKPEKGAVLLGVTIIFWYLTPSSNAFWDTISSVETYQIIADRFFPKPVEW